MNNAFIIFVGSLAFLGLFSIVASMILNKKNNSCDDDIFDY